MFHWNLYSVLVAVMFLLAFPPGTTGTEPPPGAYRRFTVPAPAGDREVPPTETGRAPRVGLALAGGGAKASASVGVLKVLREAGISVEAIAGTSMGALVGGLAAAGHAPDEIERIFLENDWNDLFTDTPSRMFLTQEQKEAGSHHLLQFNFIGGRFIPPSGLTAGQKLANLLTAHTLAASFQAGFDFDRLPIRFRAVATDLETGNAVAVGHGLLQDAMRASAAVPVLFPPVEIDGRTLVDGGLANNLPVDVVRAMGVDLVIAVDPSSKLAQQERLTNLMEVMDQSIAIPVRRETERQARLADVVIIPDTNAFAFSDFARMDGIIRAGEAAARAALPAVRKAIDAKAAERPMERYRITSLSVTGTVCAPGSVTWHVCETLLVSAGVTSADITRALEAMYDSGLFAELSLDLVRKGPVFTAVLTTRDNPVVEAVRISGNAMVSAAEVMDALTDQLGRTYNARDVARSLDRIVKRYQDQGYLLVRVASVHLEADRKTLAVVLNEGRVDAIWVEGQEQTQPSLIWREVGTEVGQPLNFRTLERDIQHLYGMNLFASLNLRVEPSDEGGAIVTFKVREKPRSTVRLGLRYDLDDAFTGLTDVIVENLWGRGVRFFITTRYGNYTDLAAGYYSPVLLDAYFVHSIQAFYRNRTYFLYDDLQHPTASFEMHQAGIDFAFGYQWFRFGDTYLRYRYESVRPNAIYGVTPWTQPATVSSLAFLSTIDTRDHEYFPRRGVLVKGSYETASDSFGGNTSFRKLALSGQAALTFAERHTAVVAFTAGLGSGQLPYPELFGVGGADWMLGFPLLGYERREIVGSQTLGASVGYRWAVAEYQLAAVRAVYLNLSAGAANAWDKRSDMSLQDLRNGTGIGLHADTIVGPFRLDFGTGRDRRYVVYFSAGFDF